MANPTDDFEKKNILLEDGDEDKKTDTTGKLLKDNEEDKKKLKDGEEDNLETNINHGASVEKFTKPPEDYDFVNAYGRTEKIRNFEKDANAYVSAVKKEEEQIQKGKQKMAEANKELQEEKEKPVEEVTPEIPKDKEEETPDNPIPDGELENKELTKNKEKYDVTKKNLEDQDAENNKKTGEAIAEVFRGNEAKEDNKGDTSVRSYNT